jgi:hypothetical protein
MRIDNIGRRRQLFKASGKSMKHLIIAIAALTTLTASAQLGVDAIAKQRARDAANQNNNRSMTPPAAGGAAAAARPRPVPPTITATPLTPSQQAYANFQSQLFAVNTNTAANLKPTLAKDMASVAQGANKPSEATLNKLSDHLTTAYGETTLKAPQKTRLAQDIAVLLNSANTSTAQKEAMIQDVESILQTGGASADNASAVAADLKTVTDEVKPAAK